MELVSTMEISGEEREIADAYARGQCAANAEGIDGINSNLDGQARFIGDASIVFNQLISAKDTNNVNGTVFSFSNGIATITGNARANGGRLYNVTNKYVNIINGHKYIFYGATKISWFATSEKDSSVNMQLNRDINIVKNLFTATIDVKNAIIGYNVENGTEYNTSGKFALFDITEMFGAGNEPTIEQFEAMFPNDYYPYTESTPISNYGIYNTLNESLGVNASLNLCGTKAYTEKMYYAPLKVGDIFSISKKDISATISEDTKIYQLDDNGNIIDYWSIYGDFLPRTLTATKASSYLGFQRDFSNCPLMVNYGGIINYQEYRGLSNQVLTDKVAEIKNDLSDCRKKSDITTNETLIGTFNGKNYYRKLFTGISGSGSSITVNVGGKIEIYNYYGRAYTYGQSGASDVKYPIPNKNYYIDSQNASETSFQLTIPTSSDTRKVDLVIEYTKVDE